MFGSWSKGLVGPLFGRNWALIGFRHAWLEDGGLSVYTVACPESEAARGWD